MTNDQFRKILIAIRCRCDEHRTPFDLRTFYRDYTTVASSSGIRIAPDADTTLLTAQFTSLLCSYWWGARF